MKRRGFSGNETKLTDFKACPITKGLGHRHKFLYWHGMIATSHMGCCEGSLGTHATSARDYCKACGLSLHSGGKEEFCMTIKLREVNICLDFFP